VAQHLLLDGEGQVAHEGAAVGGLLAGQLQAQVALDQVLQVLGGGGGEGQGKGRGGRRGGGGQEGRG
jgi:hypothetical protein